MNMKVKTCYKNCKYITAGKLYHLSRDDWGFVFIVDDNGRKIAINPPEQGSCNHLDKLGSWKYHATV